jgi:CelD/BcsL family acetyltransferase involved in cellulose biosynthesis
MEIYRLDPLRDPRWGELIGRHPRASVFHTPAWLKSLEQTYGFEPVAFTTSAPAEKLTNALVFCVVRSRLTGRRLVSLPFSDHCEPLVDDADDLRMLCSFAVRLRSQERWRYVEIRPASPIESAPADGFETSQTFYLHRLDLRPDLATIVRGFHKDSIRRKIRRAEREGLTYEEGRGEPALRQLCHLLELTRDRHRVPLQPLSWFGNLVDNCGDDLCIRIASRAGEPVAGMMTLRHASTLVYKYGGSDARLHPLGGVPFLFWRTIEEARRGGVLELDLGRSDRDNPGLVTFKEHLGAQPFALRYWRAPRATRGPSTPGWPISVMKQVFFRLPRRVRRAAGGYLYPHLG